MSTDQFEYWLDGAPVAASGGDNELNVWLDAAPVLGADSSYLDVSTRRRVTMSFID